MKVCEITGKVAIVNPSLDIALLAVDADFSALPELSLAADDSLAIGGWAYRKLRVRGRLG